MTSSSKKFVTIVTADEQQFRVPLPIAIMSGTVKNLVADLQEIGVGCGCGGGNPDDNAESGGASGDNSIPLPNVAASTYQLVLDYCTHHHENPTPPIVSSETPQTTESLAAIVGEFDNAFVGKMDSNAVLFEVMLAANYLDIKPLLDVCCKAVAAQIRGKTPEEIRKAFNIVNDFTPEEEAQVRKENEWAPEETEKDV